MLPELLQKANLFHLLCLIDNDIAEYYKKLGCSCNGPLHVANYPRKPRGGPNVPDEDMIRHSLCCGFEGCRKRFLPPSCRFFGRKVYWSAIILVVMALRQNRPNGYSINRLKKMFNIPYKTIRRWIKFFQEIFPSSPQWQRLRGRIASSVSNNELPGSLLWYFIRHFKDNEKGLIECLKFLSTGFASP